MTTPSQKKFWTNENGRYTHNDFTGQKTSKHSAQLLISVFPEASNLTKARNAIEAAVKRGYLTGGIHIEIVDTNAKENWGIPEIQNGSDRSLRGKEICIFVDYILAADQADKKDKLESKETKTQNGKYIYTSVQCKVLLLKLWRVLQDAGVQLGYVTPQRDELDLGDENIITPFACRVLPPPMTQEEEVKRYSSRVFESIHGHGILGLRQYNETIFPSPLTYDFSISSKDLQTYAISVDGITISSLRIKYQQHYLEQLYYYVLSRFDLLVKTYTKAQYLANTQILQKQQESSGDARELKQAVASAQPAQCEAKAEEITSALDLPKEYTERDIGSSSTWGEINIMLRICQEYKTFFVGTGLTTQNPGVEDIFRAINSNRALQTLVRKSDATMSPIFDAKLIAKNIFAVEIQQSSNALTELVSHISNMHKIREKEIDALQEDFSYEKLDCIPRLKQYLDSTKTKGLVRDLCEKYPYEMQKILRVLVHILREEQALKKETDRLDALYAEKSKAVVPSSKVYAGYLAMWSKSLAAMQVSFKEKEKQKAQSILGSTVTTIATTTNSSMSLSSSSTSSVSYSSASSSQLSSDAKEAEAVVLACSIDLLIDYTKNDSCFSRFFSGNWNRHHISEVQKIIDSYNSGSLTTQNQLVAALMQISVSNSDGSLAQRIAVISAKVQELETMKSQENISSVVLALT